jgi:hypothetical protein
LRDRGAKKGEEKGGRKEKKRGKIKSRPWKHR